MIFILFYPLPMQLHTTKCTDTHKSIIWKEPNRTEPNPNTRQLVLALSCRGKSFLSFFRALDGFSRALTSCTRFLTMSRQRQPLPDDAGPCLPLQSSAHAAWRARLRLARALFYSSYFIFILERDVAYVPAKKRPPGSRSTQLENKPASPSSERVPDDWENSDIARGGIR